MSLVASSSSVVDDGSPLPPLSSPCNAYIHNNLFGMETAVRDTSYVVYNLYLRRLREMQQRGVAMAAAAATTTLGDAAIAPPSMVSSIGGGVGANSTAPSSLNVTASQSQRVYDLLSSGRRSSNKRMMTGEGGGGAVGGPIDRSEWPTIPPSGGSPAAAGAKARKMPPPPPMAAAPLIGSASAMMGGGVGGAHPSLSSPLSSPKVPSPPNSDRKGGGVGGAAHGGGGSNGSMSNSAATSPRHYANQQHQHQQQASAHTAVSSTVVAAGTNGSGGGVDGDRIGVRGILAADSAATATAAASLPLASQQLVATARPPPPCHRQQGQGERDGGEEEDGGGGPAAAAPRSPKPPASPLAAASTHVSGGANATNVATCTANRRRAPQRFPAYDDYGDAGTSPFPPDAVGDADADVAFSSSTSARATAVAEYVPTTVTYAFLTPFLRLLVDTEQLGLGASSQRASKRRQLEALLARGSSASNNNNAASPPPSASSSSFSPPPPSLVAAAKAMVTAIASLNELLVASVYEAPLPSAQCPRSGRIGLQSAVREALTKVRALKARLEDGLNTINAFAEAEDADHSGYYHTIIKASPREAERDRELEGGQPHLPKKRKKKGDGAETESGSDEEGLHNTCTPQLLDEAALAARDEAVRTVVYDLSDQLYGDLLGPRIAVGEAMLCAAMALGLRTPQYVRYAVKSIVNAFKVVVVVNTTAAAAAAAGVANDGGAGLSSSVTAQQVENSEGVPHPSSHPSHPDRHHPSTLCFMPMLMERYLAANPTPFAGSEQCYGGGGGAAAGDGTTGGIPLSWFTEAVLDDAEEVLEEAQADAAGDGTTNGEEAQHQQQGGASSPSLSSSSLVEARKALIALRVLLQEVPSEQSRCLLDAVMVLGRLFTALEGEGDKPSTPQSSAQNSHNTSATEDDGHHHHRPPKPSNSNAHHHHGTNPLLSTAAPSPPPSLLEALSLAVDRRGADFSSVTLTSTTTSLIEQSPLLEALCDELLALGVVDAEMWLEDTVRQYLKQYRQQQQEQQQQEGGGGGGGGALMGRSVNGRRAIVAGGGGGGALSRTTSVRNRGGGGSGHSGVVTVDVHNQSLNAPPPSTVGGQRTPTAQMSRTTSSGRLLSGHQQQSPGGGSSATMVMTRALSGNFSTPRKRQQIPSVSAQYHHHSGALEVTSEGEEDDDDAYNSSSSLNRHHQQQQRRGNNAGSSSGNLLLSSSAYLGSFGSTTRLGGASGGNTNSSNHSIEALVDRLDGIMATPTPLTVAESLALTGSLYDVLGRINMYLRRMGMAKETRTTSTGKVVPVGVGGLDALNTSAADSANSSSNLLGATTTSTGNNGGVIMGIGASTANNRVYLEHTIDDGGGSSDGCFGRRESALYEQACLCYEQWSNQNRVRLELDALLSMADDEFYRACDARDMLRPLLAKADEYCVAGGEGALSSEATTNDGGGGTSSSAVGVGGDGDGGGGLALSSSASPRDLVVRRMDTLLIMRVKAFHHSGEVRVVTVPQRITFQQLMVRLGQFFGDLLIVAAQPPATNTSAASSPSPPPPPPPPPPLRLGCEVSFLDDGDKVRMSSQGELNDLVKMRRAVVIEGMLGLGGGGGLGASQMGLGLGRSQLVKSLMSSSELKIELYLDPILTGPPLLPQQQPRSQSQQHHQPAAALPPQQQAPSTQHVGVGGGGGAKTLPSGLTAAQLRAAMQQHAQGRGIDPSLLQPSANGNANANASPLPVNSANATNNHQQPRVGLNELIRQQEREDMLRLEAMWRVGGGVGGNGNGGVDLSRVSLGQNNYHHNVNGGAVGGGVVNRNAGYSTLPNSPPTPAAGGGGANAVDNTYHLGSIGTTDLTTFFDRKMAEKGLVNPPPIPLVAPPPPPVATAAPPPAPPPVTATGAAANAANVRNMFLAMGKARAKPSGDDAVAEEGQPPPPSSALYAANTNANANTIVNSSVVMVATQQGARWRVPPNNPAGGVAAAAHLGGGGGTVVMGGIGSSVRINTTTRGAPSGSNASTLNNHMRGGGGARPATASTLVIADTNTSDADEDEMDALIASPTWNRTPSQLSSNGNGGGRPLTAVDHIHAVMYGAGSGVTGAGGGGGSGGPSLRFNGPMRRGGVPLPQQAKPSSSPSAAGRR